MEGNNFVMLQRQKLIDGHADKEAVSLLYGWIGNMMTAMCLRYKRGNRTMRLGIRVMSKGRKALRHVYRGNPFSDEGRDDFEVAFDLALEFAPSLSKSELRQCFALADGRAQQHKQRMEKKT